MIMGLNNTWWYEMKKVVISDEAKKFILDRLKKSNKDTVVIHFEGFAWGGPKFGIAITQPNENDKLIYDNEFKLYIDPIADQWLDEVNISLKRSIFGKYIKIKGSSEC